MSEHFSYNFCMQEIHGMQPIIRAPLQAVVEFCNGAQVAALLALGLPPGRRPELLALQHRRARLAHDAPPEGLPRKQAGVGRVLHRDALGLCGHSAVQCRGRGGQHSATKPHQKRAPSHLSRGRRHLTWQQKVYKDGHGGVPRREKHKHPPLHRAQHAEEGLACSAACTATPAQRSTTQPVRSGRQILNTRRMQGHSAAAIVPMTKEAI